MPVDFREKAVLALDLCVWWWTTRSLRKMPVPPPKKTVLVSGLFSLPGTLKTEILFVRRLEAEGFRPVFVLAERSFYNTKLLRIVFDSRAEILSFSELARSEDDGVSCEKADAILKEAGSLGEFIAFELDGVRIGRNVLSAVVRNLRAANVDFSNSNHFQLIRGKLVEALVAKLRLARLLDVVRPDTALFNERGYTPAGELFDLCLMRGIDVIQWLGAPQAGSLLFKRYLVSNRAEHPLALSDETWSAISSAPWSDAQDARIMDLLSSNYESGAWFNRQQLQEGKSIISSDEVRSQLGVKPGRKIAVVFSHILYDATFFYGESIFADYSAWLKETVREAIANPNLHWVIKVHPVNVWRSKQDGAPLEQLEATLLRDEFGDLPDHISIMPADTKINTYALFRTIDYGLTVRGTVGMELPCFGIPTVTAGTGRYSGRGFTIDPGSAEDYRATLQTLHEVPRLSSRVISLARRYAFGTFMLRPFKMQSFKLAFNIFTYGSPIFSADLRLKGAENYSLAPDLSAFADFVCRSRSQDFLAYDPANVSA